jgi:sugar phosphate isomerase/epimerase
MGVFPRADQLIAFADRIDSPLVGICYDIANAHFIGEDTAAGLRQVRSRLGIAHLSDTGRAAWRHDPVGQGTCDFAGFGAALREIGYAGTSMLEIVADPPVEHIVASHRQLARWGWAPL